MANPHKLNATAVRSGETIIVTHDDGRRRTFGPAALFRKKNSLSDFNRNVKNVRQNGRCSWLTPDDHDHDNRAARAQHDAA